MHSLSWINEYNCHRESSYTALTLVPQKWPLPAHTGPTWVHGEYNILFVPWMPFSLENSHHQVLLGILLRENHELYCGLSFLCHNLKSLYHPGCASSEHILVYFYAFRMVAPKTQRLPRPLLSSPLSNESNRKENWYAGVHANYLIRTALITDWEMFNVSSKIPRFPSWRQCSVNTLETKHGGGGWHPISWIYLVNSLQGSCVVCFSNSIIYSINTYVPCHTHKNISSWS